MEPICIKTHERADQDIEITSVEELDAAIDRLARKHREHPIIVDLMNAAGDCLSAGVGADHSVLTFTRAGGGSTAVSLGDESANPEEHVVFLYGGQWTGIRKKNLIPEPLAREAVRYWFREGEITDAVRWTPEG